MNMAGRIYWTPERMAEVKAEIDSNPTLPYADVAERLAKRWGERVTAAGLVAAVYRLLKPSPRRKAKVANQG